MKKMSIAGICLAAVLLVLGATVRIPDKYIRSYGDGKMYEYVGGDAYNYITEAALRGGEISGAYTKRAVYLSSGVILLALSLFGMAYAQHQDEAKTGDELTRLTDAVGRVEASVQKLCDSVAEINNALEAGGDLSQDNVRPLKKNSTTAQDDGQCAGSQTV